MLLDSTGLASEEDERDNEEPTELLLPYPPGIGAEVVLPIGEPLVLLVEGTGEIVTVEYPPVAVAPTFVLFGGEKLNEYDEGVD